ncbi:MAG: DUF5678 domain-containing protein [Candidatus Omnitrophota bacterium]
MIQTLIKDSGYEGKYVALKSFNDSTVISNGITPQEAYEKAIEKGFARPVLIFVPVKDMVQIY